MERIVKVIDAVEDEITDNETAAAMMWKLLKTVASSGGLFQRVKATLGRLDRLKAAGRIDGLVKCLARFSGTLCALSAAKDPKVSIGKAKQWGPALFGFYKSFSNPGHQRKRQASPRPPFLG